MNSYLHIERITSKKDIPFELLLLADETLDAIGKYIYDSDIYVARQIDAADAMAVFVLQLIATGEIEIKNIAVAASFRGTGIGSRLIGVIRQIAKQQDCNTIWVGTPDCAIKEINFYEKNGFEKAGLKKNFFVDNYAEPIFDNGIMLKDMLMLRLLID